MSFLKIYAGFGIELEYMIVKNRTMDVLPISDEILKEVTGDYNSDFDNEEISWSNELVLHVIEIKTNGPAKSLEKLEEFFHKNVMIIKNILKKWDATLLPSGAHPFFNPEVETKLWPHENNPVYDAYNRIFGCKGHGWSNLQSTHINLPFANDEEFKRLHAAIRFLMPIIPGLTASTPIIGNGPTGFIDTRLNYYRNNQKKIPSLTGDLIPEILISKNDYSKNVFEKIYHDITPHDTDDILKHEWLNSRGAIARFDRNSIEIRIIDLQESPLADVSLSALIIETLHLLSENDNYLDLISEFNQNTLVDIFTRAIVTGEMTSIREKSYLSVFGLENDTTISELWKHIHSLFKSDRKFMSDKQYLTSKEILGEGTLSTRILKMLDNNYSMENILVVYHQLEKCLNDNTLFKTT